VVNRRILQVLTTVIALFSLGAASVSACTCPHPEPAAQSVEANCHGHTDASEAEERHHDGREATRPDDVSGTDEICVCAAIVSKLPPKSETVKIQKQAALASTGRPAILAIREDPRPAILTVFKKPFYLSDSFYNLAPKRGPPSV
jgi:hypothetical protein